MPAEAKRETASEVVSPTESSQQRPLSASPIYAGDEVEILNRESAYCIGLWRNLLIVMWRSPPTVTKLEKVDSLFQQLSTAQPATRFVVVLVILDGTANPSDAAKKRHLELTEHHKNRVKWVAIVVESRGLAATMMRSVVGFLMYFTASQVVQKVFSSPRNAAVWLASKLQGAEPGQISDAIEAVRSQLLATLPSETQESLLELGRAMVNGARCSASYDVRDIANLFHAVEASALAELGNETVARIWTDSGLRHRELGELTAAAFEFLSAARLSPLSTSNMDFSVEGDKVKFGPSNHFPVSSSWLHTQRERKVNLALQFYATEMRSRTAAQREREVAAQLLRRDLHMAGGFAHIIRNALTPGCIHADNGLRALRTQSSESQLGKEGAVEESLHAVGRSLRKALSSTDQILRYAEIGSQRIDAAPTHVRDAVCRVEAQLASAISRCRVEIDNSVAKNVTLHIEPGHLIMLFEELVSNALNAFSRQQPIASEKRIFVHATVDANFVHLTVADNAGGMPSLTKEKAFQPLFTTEPAARLGLGLALVQKLVSLHGGSVHLESIHRRGTTVLITVPSCPSDQTAVISSSA